MFQVIEDLRPVGAHAGQPRPAGSKTLFVPMAKIVDVAGLQDQEMSPEEVLDLHYRRDLETLPCTTDRVRGELVEELYELLLPTHPAYRTLPQPTVMASIRASMETMVTMGLVSEEDPPPRQRQYSVLMPDQHYLTSHQRQILRVRALDTKLGAVYDLEGVAGVEQEGREVPITSWQWAKQRLGHVRRDGPMDQPGLVLALALQHTTARIHSARDLGEDSLVDRPGTRAYHRRVLSKLVTQGQWHGPTTFSISVAPDGKSEIMLANWVSHDARVHGRAEQVWHRGSEQQLLTRRPGKEQEEQEDPHLQGSFFVHCKVMQRESSCSFHFHCHRESVEERRER